MASFAGWFQGEADRSTNPGEFQKHLDAWILTLKKDLPKTKIIMLHAKGDEWCPFKNTEEYARRAKEQGLDVTLHIQKGKHDFKSLSGRNEIFKEIFSNL